MWESGPGRGLLLVSQRWPEGQKELLAGNDLRGSKSVLENEAPLLKAKGGPPSWTLSRMPALASAGTRERLPLEERTPSDSASCQSLPPRAPEGIPSE